MIEEQSPFWAAPVSDLLERLQTSPQGLTTDEAEERQSRYGPNLLEPTRKAPALILFLEQFKSPLVLILIGAALVSAFLSAYADAAIVLAIVLGSTILSFAQEYAADNAVEKLRATVTINATLLRDGESVSLPAEQVVPGDLVLLSAGSLIPADGVVLEAKDFFVNQAVLTGETFPVEKTPGRAAVRASLAERTNCVFMGTNVRSGSARVVIAQTGKDTAYGGIAKRLQFRPPETEFESGIRNFGLLLTQVMFILVLAAFAINMFFARPVLESLLFAVALAVGLTPELMPAIISIGLSRGAQAMAKKGVIVRRLSSIENFGSMDVLCTDKTGTLTEGVVTLDVAADALGQASDEVFRYAYINARLQTGLTNPLDQAILARWQPDVSDVTKVDEIPYDFVRKRLSVVIQDTATQNEPKAALLITKGALEGVLSVCSYAQGDQVTLTLDDEYSERIRERYEKWSGQGLRVLGVAIKLMPLQTVYTHDEERDLIFVGFLLFFDPPKPDVLDTIARLSQLGVQLKIITGDNRLVAAHVADMVGMQVTGVLTGAQLDDLREEALWQMAERTNLFAEVDPNDKERIIEALKRMGHVVGFMGDGINDAPALYAADVGISVNTAMDVAKEAADFVLLERDLDVLSHGILEGRRTFANTLKYVFYTTSANFGNMFSMAGATLFLPFLPLLPKQYLLNNFLSDIPTMTIATDSVDGDWVDKPHRWNVRFIRNFMVIFGLVSSIFDYATFGALLLVAHAAPDEFRTGWFIESLLTELMILLVMRTRSAFFRSRPGKWVVLSTLAVAVIAFLVPYLPFNGLLGFTPLPLPFLLLILAITGLYILATEIAKRFFYRRNGY